MKATETLAPDACSFWCKKLGLPTPVRELVFHPIRKWRFDWAFPSLTLAVEKDGAVWTGGRHTRGKGVSEDCIKFSEAAVLGWTVLRFTTQQVNDGTAVSYVLKVAETIKRRQRDGQEGTSKQDV